MIGTVRKLAAQKALHQHESGHGKDCGAKRGPARGSTARQIGHRQTENRDQHSVPAMNLHRSISAEPETGMDPTEYGRHDRPGGTAINKYAHCRL